MDVTEANADPVFEARYLKVVEAIEYSKLIKTGKPPLLKLIIISCEVLKIVKARCSLFVME